VLCLKERTVNEAACALAAFYTPTPMAKVKDIWEPARHHWPKVKVVLCDSQRRLAVLSILLLGI